MTSTKVAVSPAEIWEYHEYVLRWRDSTIAFCRRLERCEVSQEEINQIQAVVDGTQHIAVRLEDLEFFQCIIGFPIAWPIDYGDKNLRLLLSRTRDSHDCNPLWVCGHVLVLQMARALLVDIELCNGLDDRNAILSEIASSALFFHQVLERITRELLVQEARAAEQLLNMTKVATGQMASITTIDANDRPIESPGNYVTMLQMASFLRISKKTIARLYERGYLPAPEIEGGNGKSHQWRWDTVRLLLQEKYGKAMPDVFPAAH